jgi:hypothetical protein
VGADAFAILPCPLPSVFSPTGATIPVTNTDQAPCIPDPSDEFQQILARLQQADEARLKQAKTRLRDEIIPRLKQWGVARIVVDYSGCGDSGGIDGISYFDAAGQPANMALVQTASDPDIGDVAYEFLPAGFENNEGGQGTLTLDVEAGTVKIAHSENYTATTDTTEEFTL